MVWCPRYEDEGVNGDGVCGVYVVGVHGVYDIPFTRSVLNEDEHGVKPDDVTAYTTCYDAIMAEVGKVNPTIVGAWLLGSILAIWALVWASQMRLTG